MTIYDDASRQIAKAVDAGDRILFTGAAVGCVIAIVNDLQSHNGISHTWGSLLVIASSALLVLASLVLALNSSLVSPWRILLTAALLFDLLGTAVAAYFLESTWLIAAMAVAFVGWIIRVWFSPNIAERRHHGTRRLAR